MRAPLLAALIVTLTSCDRAPAQAGDPVEQAFQGLCEAGTLSAQGQVEEAGEVFQDRSHDFLHELAADVQDADPAAAAALLEAKQRVEAALADPASEPEALPDLLVALRRAFAGAARALGETVPACPEDR
jgi:hypothetical protein